MIADLKLLCGDTPPLTPGATTELLLQWAEQSKFRLIGLQLPADAIQLIAFFQQTGFAYIDVTLAVDYSPLKIEKLPRLRTELCLAGPQNQAEIEALAAQVFQFGRFHADARFPRDLADKRYADWVRRAGEATSTQQILISRDTAGLAGFSVIEASPNTAGYFHLLAVAPRLQSSPFAAALLASTLRHFHEQGIRAVHSKISASHFRVLNLHAFHGAKFSSPQVLLHWHPPASAEQGVSRV
jgi:ribosomal protein S18 acetylase RimI-like enzyme